MFCFSLSRRRSLSCSWQLEPHVAGSPWSIGTAFECSKLLWNKMCFSNFKILQAAWFQSYTGTQHHNNTQNGQPQHRCSQPSHHGNKYQTAKHGQKKTHSCWYPSVAYVADDIFPNLSFVKYSVKQAIDNLPKKISKQYYIPRLNPTVS